MTYEIKKIITFFVMCFLVLSVLFVRIDRDIELKETEDTTSSQHTQYTIKDYNGKIAVFENNDTFPKSIYDSYTSVLPESDRKLLEDGIMVTNKSELQRIIEDYTS